MRHILTRKDFLRLWDQIIIKGDFRFVWPQGKILKALKKKRFLRFVREDLFECSISVITKKVLQGCLRSNYGLLVKTSSVNVVNYIPEIKRIKHCIVFSITDLLKDYWEKVKAVNTCVKAGLNVTLSLSPIFEFNDKIKYILSSVERKILGVEIGWLHGSPSLIPPEYLNREGYKYVRWEKQYKERHLKKVVEDIKKISSRKGIAVRFYFNSMFYKKGACCFIEKT
jgi:DNA repair photolyase